MQLKSETELVSKQHNRLNEVIRAVTQVRVYLSNMTSLPLLHTILPLASPRSVCFILLSALWLQIVTFSGAIGLQSNSACLLGHLHLAHICSSHSHTAGNTGVSGRSRAGCSISNPLKFIPHKVSALRAHTHTDTHIHTHTCWELLGTNYFDPTPSSSRFQLPLREKCRQIHDGVHRRSWTQRFVTSAELVVFEAVTL